jgi:Undecaprenyl-phosphate glucose phosphotransferase
MEDLRALLKRLSPDLVIVTLPHAESARLADILEKIGDDPVTIHFVPDVAGLASLRGGIETFEGIPFIHLRESPLYGWNRLLKRAFDLVLGTLVLLLVSPLMVVVALLVKFTSPGPVLFWQERMGLDGRSFAMLKFRTMRVDAESQTGPVWTRPEDPRRTAVGTFLRRWSLDELPQLFNVLRGEMSLVGPRPERPELVQEFRPRIPGYMLRHKVKAGMTGWAQINGWRGDTSLERRIQCDLYYIERWSLGFDLKIMILTMWRGFFSDNAY